MAVGTTLQSWGKQKEQNLCPTEGSWRAQQAPNWRWVGGDCSRQGLSEARPAFWVDRSSRIVACNPAAQRLYGISIGDIVAAAPFDALVVAAIAKIACCHEQSFYPHVISGERSDSRSVVVAVVGPADEDGLLVRTTDLSCSQSMLDRLVQQLGLTRAEAAVACGIAEGCSLDTIAGQRRVKGSTVRAQLRSVFHKTGTNSQAELARLLLGLFELSVLWEPAVKLRAASPSL